MKPFALALVGSLLFPSCATVSDSEPPERPWGPIVRLVSIETNAYIHDGAIRGRLKTVVGKPLRKEDLIADVKILWTEFGLRASVHYKLVKKGVNVVFRIEHIAKESNKVRSGVHEGDKRWVWGPGVSTGTSVRRPA